MNKIINIPTLTDSDKARFWGKVNKLRSKKACWEWSARTIDKDGYGRFYLKDKLLRSNRVSFFIHYKKDPFDKHVCHSCDNPKCCNPYHLFLGTAKDNVQDALKKGRWPIGDKHWTIANPATLARGKRNGHYTKPENTPKGETHGMSKITEKDVRNIRKRYSRGDISQDKLAIEYNMTQVNISEIVRNRIWRNVV